MNREIQPTGKQKEVLALPPVGHTVVLGTAGSGKTTMALFRAIGLANLPNKPRVLVVTFNTALVQYMSNICKVQLPNLTIENYHKFARGYLHSIGKMPGWGGILQNKDDYVEMALKEIKQIYPDESTLKRPLSAYLDEIAFIEKFGIQNEEQYYQVERIGRAAMNIRRENRKWIYMVYNRYREIRRNNGINYDWDDIALYVYEGLLEDKKPRRYQHIIVDEGQDFSPMMLRSLIEAVGTGGSFSFFGDVSQQIYGGRLSWRDAGIKIGERGIWRFKKNYRNEGTIALFAKDITKSKYWEKNADAVEADEMVAMGPKPILVRFDTEQREMEWVVELLKQKRSEGSSNVVVCRTHEILNSIRKKLVNAGIHPTMIDKTNGGYCVGQTVYLTTYHTVKGLEFDNVFMPMLSADKFPDKEKVEQAVSADVVKADELKLLYVAATRAKFGLFMSYHRELTELFLMHSAYCDYVEGADII